jgi:hemerythrin-like domain-containing protein
VSRWAGGMLLPTRGAMDAIEMLEQDHRRVEDLFDQFEDAGDQAYRTKGELAERIVTELRIHSELEEQIFYPAARNSPGNTADPVREAIEEHHVVAQLLDEIEVMDPGDEQFDAKVTVLRENVEHHVEEEEGELFKEARKALGEERLQELADEMGQLRKRLQA